MVKALLHLSFHLAFDLYNTCKLRILHLMFFLSPFFIFQNIFYGFWAISTWIFCNFILLNASWFVLFPNALISHHPPLGSWKNKFLTYNYIITMSLTKFEIRYQANVYVSLIFNVEYDFLLIALQYRAKF